MPRIHNQDLVLKPSMHVDTQKWDESKYDAFVDELCQDREYQKEAIFAVLRYLLSGNYENLCTLAKENFDKNPKLEERHGSWKAMKAALQFPDVLSCTLDLATGTGKSYVLYGIAAIMLAEGEVDRVLTLCPSLTIERGLAEKFRLLAGDDNLRTALPENAIVRVPKIISADETVTEGCICVENYHAVLERTRSSIEASFTGKGKTTLVLNDEAHHVATTKKDSKKWKEFLVDKQYGFNYIVGVSGTCYVDSNYFTDVISHYSLRQAIEENIVKDVEYVTEAKHVRGANVKYQHIYQNHQANIEKLRRFHIRPLTIIVANQITTCERVADELKVFLQQQENINATQANEKVLVVTSAPQHKRNIMQLHSVDSPQSGVEWIVSVSMLTEGWDVKNVFQIVPHEERAFNSKLLISQVLGRGLRVPEKWTSNRPQPVVTVFNHDAWAEGIKNLVNEILDIEQRVSCRIIADSPHHFEIHNLNYDRDESEISYHTKQGEYDLFTDGWIHLPGMQAEEPVTLELEKVRGKARVVRHVIKHKSFTVEQIANHMHSHLLGIDQESATETNIGDHTNYVREFSLERLESIVRESVRRAKINEDAIPDEARQRFLSSLNVLNRKESKRVRYVLNPKLLVIKNTAERHEDSCSAAELRNGKRTIFYRPSCADYLLLEQKDFFKTLSDRDGEFRGQTEQVDNDYHFKVPTNLVIANHDPERRFVRDLLKSENADQIDSWIKNPDKGFYQIEYSWSKEHNRRSIRGMFSPDFLIKLTNELICVVEIKDDSEIKDPSKENVAKYRQAMEHFDTLNKWLEKDNITTRYHFNMLTPQDYGNFFSYLLRGDIKSYSSTLDVALAK